MLVWLYNTAYSEIITFIFQRRHCLRAAYRSAGDQYGNPMCSTRRKIGQEYISEVVPLICFDEIMYHIILITFRLWTDGKRSVCSVKIETGRTHQIRVHAQYLGTLLLYCLRINAVFVSGFPIVNDQLYNSAVWGLSRGKNAQYGKSYEEVAYLYFRLLLVFII